MQAIYVSYEWFKTCADKYNYFISWQDRTLPVDQREYEVIMIGVKQ